MQFTILQTLCQGSGNSPYRAVTPADVFLWIFLGVVSALLMLFIYLRLQSRFSAWMYRARRNTVAAYLSQVVLGIIIAFLIDRIGFRELIEARMSAIDAWLMPIFAILLPPFVLISVMIPVGTAAEVDRINAAQRALEQYKRLYLYMGTIRDDVARLADCVAGAWLERTKRLRELADRSEQQSCSSVAGAFDGTVHTDRLIEAVHYLFEQRARSAPLEASDNPGDPAESASVSWRVALYEVRDD